MDAITLEKSEGTFKNSVIKYTKEVFIIKLPPETNMYLVAWVIIALLVAAKAQYLQIIKLIIAPVKAPKNVANKYQLSLAYFNKKYIPKSAVVAIIAAIW